MINLAAMEGGSIAGRVEHVPEAMAGQVWVVAFNENIIRREARAGRDGAFRLDGLPAGRYGVKVGHDAYKDPHIPVIRPFSQERTPEELAQWKKKAEPWQGAVDATVRSSSDDLGPAPRLPPSRSSHRAVTPPAQTGRGTDCGAREHDCATARHHGSRSWVPRPSRRSSSRCGPGTRSWWQRPFDESSGRLRWLFFQGTFPAFASR